MKFKLRRGTSSEWIAKNPVLAAGEPGVETDTCKLKVGDGVSKWTVLGYISSDSSGSPAIEDLITDHVQSETPHPVYDDGPSLVLLYENAKV